MELSTEELMADIDELKTENKRLQYQYDEMSKELASKQHRINELEHRLRNSHGKPSG
mgnify:CR=1 FL=1|tara:strand:+ start:844 stop:1014 length:171 start_codon:yes stop_codon:yes gene_type:complete